jgi:hypothetical protein
MFTRRHEQELAEIKALTHELGQRFQEILEQLERIRENQERLSAQGQPAAGGRRRAGRARAQADDGAPEEPKVAGGGGRVVPVGSSGDAPERGGRKARGGRKGRGGGRKRRQSEPATSPDSDEE